MAMMLGEARASITLDIGDLLSNADKAENRLMSLDGAAGKASGGFAKLKNGALGLGTALIAPMAMGFHEAVNLEQALADVNASLGGIDTAKLEELRRGFQEIGSASKYSAVDVAMVGDELAKRGYDPDQIIGMTRAVVDLSQATGEGLQPATDGITQAMAMWNPEVVGLTNGLTDASVAADILTNAANQSAGGVTDVIGGLRNAGPALAGAGVSFNDAAAAIALFTNYGYSGDEIGTKLTRTLTFLSKPTDEAAAAMQQYGINAFDAYGNFVGFPALFDQLQTGFAGVGDEAKLAALKTIFGAEAFDLMNLAISTGGDPLREMMKLMGVTGSAAEQSALRMNTLSAQWGELTESATAFLSSLVQGLIPGLRFFVDTANDVIDVLMRIPQPIKTIIGAIAGSLAAWAAYTRAIQGMRALDMLFGGSGTFKIPVGPILLATAAATGMYVAWRKNFGGIRDLTDRAATAAEYFGKQWQGAFDAFTKAGGKPFASALKATGAALKKTSVIMGPFGDITRKAGDAFFGFAEVVGAYDWFRNTAGMGRFGAAMNALINPTHGLVKVFPQLDRFVRPFATNMLRLSDTFGELRKTMGPVEAGLAAISQVFPRLRGVVNPLLLAFDAFQAGDYGRMFANIGEGLKGIGGLVIDAAITIGSWAFNALVDFGSALKDWLFGYTTAEGVEVDGVIVRIGRWSITAAENLWSAVKRWALGDSGNAQKFDETGGVGMREGALIQLSSVGVSIASWVINAVGDLWGAVKKAADLAWLIVSGNRHEIGPMKIKIGTFEVTIDWNALWDKMDAAWESSTTMSPDMAAKIQGWGEKIGYNLIDWINQGIQAVFSMGGGGGGGGKLVEDSLLAEQGAMTSFQGYDWFDDTLGLFFDGFQQGFDAKIDELKAALKVKWDGIWEPFKMGDFNVSDYLPDISFSKDDIPGYAAAEAAAKYVGLLVTDPVGWYRKYFGSGGDSRDVGSIQAEASRRRPENRDLPNYTPYSNPYNPAEGGDKQVLPGADVTTTKQQTAATVDLSGAYANLGSIYSNAVQKAGATAFIWAALGASQKQTYEAALANQQVVPQVATAWSGLGGALTPVNTSLQGVGTQFGVTRDTALSSTNGLASGVVSEFGSMQTGASGEASTMQGNVVGSSAGMAAGATASALLMAVGVTAGAATATGGVSSNAGMWVGIVAATAGPMAGAGMAAGMAAGMGVAVGIMAAIPAAVGAATALVGSVNAAMRSAGEIHSPSGLTRREVGLPLGMGVVAALQDGGLLRSVSAAGAGVIGAATGGMGARPWMPPVRSASGGGSVVYGGSQTVHATVHTQSTLSDSEKMQLTRQLAEASRAAREIVYVEQGV